MSYTVPAGAILEVQYRYTLAAQQMINVFFYKLFDSSADGAQDAFDFAANFWDTVGTNIKNNQTTEVGLINIRAQWIKPTRYFPMTFTPSPAQGVITPPTYSVGTSVIIRKQSDVVGRSKRGRVYIGGVARVLGGPGSLTNTAKEQIQAEIGDAMLSNLVAAGSAATCGPVVWSYRNPTASVPITRTEVDQNLRYQRRREVGRGV